MVVVGGFEVVLVDLFIGIVGELDVLLVVDCDVVLFV